MKVLWIVNTVFPKPSDALGLSKPLSGGWMFGLADKVGKCDGVELAIASVYKGTAVKKITIDEVDYFLLPCKNNIKYDNRIEEYWKQVCEQFKPDIIHIHGTEFAHGLACMRKFPNLSYIVSIQGLVSVYAKYYLGGMSFLEVLKSITFRDVVRNNNLFQAKNEFKKRGILEKEYLRRTKHVIGRTQWDSVHSRVYNAKVNYHFCNESLRNNFYEADKWNINDKNDFTIFCSQAIYPLKGLHQVLKAVEILKNDFPKIKLKIAGTNITKRKTIIEKIKISGYGLYLNRLIHKFGIQEMVEFTGKLDENQMIREYQKAHLFICSSSIENSPNSLGEAQLIGVPSIATYVGGIPDMIEEGNTGLMYRFEEYEMLANNIRKIFDDNNLAIKLSEKGIIASDIRHNGDINYKQTIKVYNLILNS
ncbi:MAG: glycosyltransferase family 4 protein [Flavobacterium sp.]|nr:glycosyltransferase family 4 protein [Flavobacterium sp.]